MRKIVFDGTDENNPVNLDNRALLFQAIKEELDFLWKIFTYNGQLPLDSLKDLLSSAHFFCNNNVPSSCPDFYSDNEGVITRATFKFSNSIHPSRFVGAFGKFHLGSISDAELFVESNCFVFFDGVSRVWKTIFDKPFPVDIEFEESEGFTTPLYIKGAKWNSSHSKFIGEKTKGDFFSFSCRNIIPILR